MVLPVSFRPVPVPAGSLPTARERRLPHDVQGRPHILAIVCRQLPINWIARYNTTPVLIETFVETPRYTGAVYRASGWTQVGTTQGRGRYDTKIRYDMPKKDIWLRPLHKDWRRVLNRP